MSLSADARADIALQMAACPKSGRKGLKKRLAARYNVSKATIYRVADLREARRKRAPLHPEYRAWVPVVVTVANRARRARSKAAPLDLALRSALEGGLLPPEAAAMPVSAIRRVAAELDLLVCTKRTRKMMADWPMQAIQFDGSTSAHLKVAEDLGNGDYLLQLHDNPMPASGYKNKPLGDDRLRVIPYAIWDMCTGYFRVHYTVARGENVMDSVEALCKMLTATGDPHRPLHGVPVFLWSDQGSLFKARAGRAFLERLNVNHEVGNPYQKTRMGGVERVWRTLWERFEGSLYLAGINGITLSEINERLIQYEIDENAMRLSRTPVDGQLVTRAVAWSLLSHERPEDQPLRPLPEDAFAALAQEKPNAKLDTSGHLRWDNVLYEAATWYDRKVLAYRAMDGSGDLVIEDPKTREREAAVRYRPRKYGDVRGVPATALDKLLAEDDGATGADPYAAGRPRPKVVAVPPPTAPPIEIDNPLSVSSPALGAVEGMRVFRQYYLYPLSPAIRDLVVQRIVDDKLDRAGVIRLAQEMMSLAESAG